MLAFGLLGLALLSGLSSVLAQDRPQPASAGLPDLTIEYLQMTLEAGGQCVLGYPYPPLGTAAYVANLGDADAGPFVLQVNDATLLVADGLAAGEHRRIWLATLRWPDASSAVIDATFVVAESNEDNNAYQGIVPIPTLPPSCTPTRTPTVTVTPTPIPMVTGDLGFRTLNGMVRGAAGGTPVPLAGATVTFYHDAALRPDSAGSTVTAPDGRYSFPPLFLHDTDRVEVRAEAAGYASQTQTRAGLATWFNPVFDFVLQAWTPTPTRFVTVRLPLVRK
jgi:hypothetical protein